MSKMGNECSGKILQHVDAGLVLCSILATYVHRRLTVASPTPGLSSMQLEEGEAAQPDDENTSGSKDAIAGDGEDPLIHSSSSAGNEAAGVAHTPVAAAAIGEQE